MTPPPFVIFALPRSRTAWLSRFLTYGEWQCGHDELRHCRSLDDVKSWFDQPCTGTAETAAASFWRLLVRYRPDARIVTVRRPVSEVVASLRRQASFDETALTGIMRQLDRKLDQIEWRVPGVLSVGFEDLADEPTCARLFEHCLRYRHDPAWWAHLAPLNIQINLGHQLRHYEAHKLQLTKLAAVARQQIIAGMVGEVAELDDVTIAPEPFDDFYRDATPLFAEHLVQTGQAPDDYLHKNIPLLRNLDRLGALQCLTARCNGRMFGYLMTVIGPSLDAPNVMQATHTIFFASPVIRGLGMKLQRAALTALRGRGVDEVLMRAGHRGSGPRLGTFYRRLGAEEFGQMYRLELEG